MTHPDFPHRRTPSAGELALEDRTALRRVAGLSTELTDISEVEYRQLRLERVVLVGVWTEGSAADVEASMAELAALAETAGSEVLEGLIQLSAACRLIEDFGEIKGPVKLIYQALIRFENYQSTYADVKVADLAATMEAWAKELEASGVRGHKPVPNIAVRRFRFF